MQWVILAIRNICEDNLENQAFIARMNKQGVVKTEMLEELGITLHEDDSNRIRIVPVEVDTLAVSKGLNSCSKSKR